MKAVVYKENGKIEMEERPRPKIREETDAVIKVTLTTICSSDLHIKHGAVPRAVPGTILGHEFVGIVEEVGSAVCKVKPGDRVAVNVETFCGECFYCRQGFVNNCTDPNGGWALGCRIDGGQAEYARIPYADNGLTRIPDHVTDEQALFTGDILSTGYWGAKIGAIKPADTVLVIGAGPTGLCTMMCAGLYSPSKIIALDTDESGTCGYYMESAADDGKGTGNADQRSKPWKRRGYGIRSGGRQGDVPIGMETCKTERNRSGDCDVRGRSDHSASADVREESDV